MQHFRNTVKNPSTSGLESASIGLLSYSYASYPYSNSHDQAPPVYYKGSALNRRMVKVKWYNICQCANHDKNEYYKKNPDLLTKYYSI